MLILQVRERLRDGREVVRRTAQDAKPHDRQTVVFKMTALVAVEVDDVGHGGRGLRAGGSGHHHAQLPAQQLR